MAKKITPAIDRIPRLHELHPVPERAIYPLPKGKLYIPDHDTFRGRAFGARRGHIFKRHTHCGLDLFAEVGDPVHAIEDGVIVAFYRFYRIRNGHYAYALLVEHGSWVANYGEVAADSLTSHGLHVGGSVTAGRRIATIPRLKDSSMMHFEAYVKGTRRNKQWRGFGRWKLAPCGLLNPTEFLRTLAKRLYQERGDID